MERISNKPVRDVITEKYEDLFQAEKKVADFILRNQEIAVEANVSELAGSSRVSDATVVRFCKHLGYEGYYQMRLLLLRDMGNMQKQKDAEADSTLDGYFKKIANLILEAPKLNDETVFKDCVDVIQNAETVHICGVGATADLCMYAGFRLERLGLRCQFNLQPELTINHMHLAGKTDCLVAVSASGTSRSVVRAMEIAKERGLRVILISAYQNSPASKLADYLLRVPHYEQRSMNEQHSRIGTMAVIEVLIKMLENTIRLDADTEILITDTEIALSDLKY